MNEMENGDNHIEYTDWYGYDNAQPVNGDEHDIMFAFLANHISVDDSDIVLESSIGRTDCCVIQTGLDDVVIGSAVRSTAYDILISFLVFDVILSIAGYQVNCEDDVE